MRAKSTIYHLYSPLRRASAACELMLAPLEAILDFFTARRVEVVGDSMAPSYRAGSCLAISTRAYRRAAPERFDVVLIEPPAGRRRTDLKRIVGLPGEHVALEGNRLTVNGRVVRGGEGGAAADAEVASRHAWRTGQDEYVVLGDNLARSTDSRGYGPIARGSIIGRVARRF